jgi:hypothetical protein
MPGWPVLADKMKWDVFSCSGVSAADLNGDGKLEVCVTLSNHIYVYDFHGQLLTGWPQDLNKWCFATGPAIIGDINGDRKPDVIVRAGALQPRAPYDFDSWGGVFAFNRDGTPIDLCAETQFYPIYMELYYSGHVSIADIDADGKIELIGVSCDNASFYDPIGRKNHDTIYVWDLDTPYRRENMPWPTWQNSPAGGGRFQWPPRNAAHRSWLLCE